MNAIPLSPKRFNQQEDVCISEDASFVEAITYQHKKQILCRIIYKNEERNSSIISKLVRFCDNGFQESQIIFGRGLSSIFVTLILSHKLFIGQQN